MQNDRKIQRRLLFLTIVNVTLLVLILGVGLSNFTYAQENLNLHQKTLDEITKHRTSEQNPHIHVGKTPLAITVDPIRDKIYVANSGEDTVSVIDPKNDRILGNIKVGRGPTDMAFSGEKLYVANRENDTVSVIDAANNTEIRDIKVGRGPTYVLPTAHVANKDITYDKEDGVYVTDTIYVANIVSNTVSAIDRILVSGFKDNYTKIRDIKVGRGPTAIAYHKDRDTIYVANAGDDSVSVIDAQVNKAVAKVMFNIEPFNAGHIECVQDKDNKSKPPIAPIAREFYVWDSSQCIAKPNQGFEFLSWQENLGGNSTQLLNFSSSPSFLDSIIDPVLHKLYCKSTSSSNSERICSNIDYCDCYSIHWHMANSHHYRMEKSKKTGK
jgi:YVTN family beta-propeller protein